MTTVEKKREKRRRKELMNCLRRLAKWQANDAVRLAFLAPEELGALEELDLLGVTELRRSANGAVEVKFADRVKVLEMLREMLREEKDSALEDCLTAFGGDGDAT